MRLSSLFVLLPLSLGLSSCAGLYSQPKQTQPHAILKDSSNRTTLTTWQETYVNFIDDKPIGIKTGTYRVSPGMHNLVVITEFNRGLLGGGPYQSITDFNFNFKNEKKYTLRSKVTGAKVMVWLEDEGGRQASGTRAAPYQTKPVSTTTTVPVVVRR